MKKFEYKEVDIYFAFETELNGWGKDGWELVQVIDRWDYGDLVRNCVFKRELE